MPKKAKINKNTPFTLEMAETYFGAVQNAFVSLREEMNAKFAAVYKRFDGVDRRLDKVENRLDKVEFRLDQVENALSDIVKKDLKDHECRILKLEKVTS